jgi:GT2 family glycosyltransferase
VSYATYPSTEYLIADNADFLAVNVYLEQREAFEKYLLRLQHLAGNKPLMISEFGLDVATHGEAKQAETRAWFEAACAHHGVAGTVWFAFTDEWHRGGEDVTQWQFGLVDVDRRPRPAASLPAPSNDLSAGPRFSVVVCTRNGSATLRACLEALSRQSYPNHEVIVVDDGSTDAVPDIAKCFPFVRYHRLNHGGLSVARNAGALLSTGDVIAYTDDDCMADEDWLAQLAPAFDNPQWVAAGGPNIPPPARNRIEALVAAAPGGPAHVMLNDEEAEHLPGCNLAIRKSALDAIGGFDPIFRTAGDDVDVCWRLRDQGGKLRFVPGAMVWHHRRFTVKAYFKQQSGYGHAEALLMKQHPQRFGPLGGARWRGAIYGDAPEPREGSIFHGPQGTGLFQVIYATGGCAWCHWLSGVLWIALALLFGALRLPWISASIGAFVAWFAWRRMSRSGAVPESLADKLKLWALCLAQPVIRELARLDGMLNQGTRPSFRPHLPDILPPQRPRKFSWRLFDCAYWSETSITRDTWLRAFRDVLREQGIPFREDDGWRWFDLELHPTRWITHSITTVTEYHGGQRMLTRIGVQRRVRWLLIGLIAMAFVSAIELPRAWLWMRLGMAGFAQLTIIWLVGGWVFYERHLKHLIQTAAECAELKTLNPPTDKGTS